MTSTATFRNIPLSTTFDRDREKSSLSLEWLLDSGSPAVRSVASGILTLPNSDGVFSVHMDLSIQSSLPADLVLGRDWLQYSRESIPEACFHLSSGPVDLRRAPIGRLASHFLFLLSFK